MVEKSLSELNFATSTNRDLFPSPAAWEDQFLYFLMLDRFSDGKKQSYRDNEGNIVASGITPMFKNENHDNATRTAEERKHWFDAGGKFTGGTLQGLASKMGYLKRLRATAIWESPIFKQVAFQKSQQAATKRKAHAETQRFAKFFSALSLRLRVFASKFCFFAQISLLTDYHGYDIQNFLDVDPHFGTREDLREMVNSAHQHGIYVILDKYELLLASIHGGSKTKARLFLSPKRLFQKIPAACCTPGDEHGNEGRGQHQYSA